MTRTLRLGVLEILAVGVTLALAWPYLGRSFAPGWDSAAFALALLVVEFFDVELPRGDSSTMSMPLVANAVLFLEPLSAMVSVLGATAVALTASLGKDRLSLLPTVAGRRLAITLLGIAYVGFTDLTITPGLGSVLLLSTGMVTMDFLYAQVQSATRLATPLGQLIAASAQLQGTMVTAKVSAALAGALLFPELGAWGLLVLVMLLLVMRQAFSLFISVRKTYQSTIGAFARIIEAQRPGKLGHSERVAELATEVARRLGMRGRDLETLAYAALLHDVVLIGELDEASDSPGAATRQAPSQMFEQVGFLASVVPLLSAAAGEGEASRNLTRGQAILSCVLLAASRTDDIAHGESTARDTASLMELERSLSAPDRMRVEEAFRLAAVKVQGSLFTVGLKDFEEGGGL